MGKKLTFKGAKVIIKNTDFSANAIKITTLVDCPKVTVSLSGEVTITSSNEVYYTINGENPSKSSTKYTSPFTVSKNTTIKAVAYKGDIPSTISVNRYEGVPAPVIDIDINGLVTLSSETSVYYTTDGAEPNSSKLLYSTPFTVSSNTTVKAVALAGRVYSDIAQQTYVQTVPAAPVISSNGNGLVTITSPVEVYYTTDGTEPDSSKTFYSAPFSVEDGTTVKAVAIHSGLSSSVAELIIYIREALKVFYNQDLDKWGDVFVHPGTVLTDFIPITPEQAAQGIDWTYNDPSSGGNLIVFDKGKTKRDVWWMKNGQTNQIIPLGRIPEGGYVRATFKMGTAGCIKCGDAIIYEYDGRIDNRVIPDEPIISIEKGGIVTIESTGYAVYRTDDKNIEYPRHLYSEPFTVPNNTKVRAATYSAGNFSTIVESTYSGVEAPPAPVMEDDGNCLVTLTSENPVYYTTDGTEPDTSKTLYSIPFTVESGTTVKAAAIVDGVRSIIVEEIIEKDTKTLYFNQSIDGYGQLNPDEGLVTTDYIAVPSGRKDSELCWVPNFKVQAAIVIYNSKKEKIDFFNGYDNGRNFDMPAKLVSEGGFVRTTFKMGVAGEVYIRVKNSEEKEVLYAYKGRMS